MPDPSKSVLYAITVFLVTRVQRETTTAWDSFSVDVECEILETIMAEKNMGLYQWSLGNLCSLSL
jgi:hypothetical protein